MASGSYNGVQPGMKTIAPFALWIKILLELWEANCFEGMSFNFSTKTLSFLFLP